MTHKVALARRAQESVAVVPLLVGRRPELPAGGLVLGYHDIDVVGEGGLLSARRFERQLRQMLEWGFQVVPLEVLVARWSSGDPLTGLVALSFDDAGSGVLRYAAPILADLGLPATVFVPSGLVGRRVGWSGWTDRVMTEPELAELRQAGIRLESHTVTHRSLPLLDDDDLRDELTASRSYLEEVSGEAVSLLAYPFGHEDERVRRAVRDAGYRAAFTYTNGRVVRGADAFGLPRLTMREAHGPVRFAAHLLRPAARWPDPALAG